MEDRESVDGGRYDGEESSGRGLWEFGGDELLGGRRLYFWLGYSLVLRSWDFKFW
jgi:hypothetical protein